MPRDVESDSEVVEVIGRVREIYRYLVKSMAGESLPYCDLGWHGLEGDRRLAFLRTGLPGGFPWLNASKLPSLITYVPLRDGDAGIPTRVRTPAGRELAIEFCRIVRRGFSQRRKMMFKLLREDWPGTALTSAFEALGLPVSIRAEAVGLTQFVNLTRMLAEKGREGTEI